jgi:hypothetical protein
MPTKTQLEIVIKSLESKMEILENNYKKSDKDLREFVIKVLLSREQKYLKFN